MKFLENEKLNELTAQLSDAILGQSNRLINGRIEAYTMKRAGNDKKFAHTLGRKYIADLEEQQQLLADLTQAATSSPSSPELNESNLHGRSSGSKRVETRKRSNSAATVLEAVQKKARHPGRMRSQSVDVTLSSKTTLGDFSELATRRLMTDLILTLNASFPDYDFSTVKPQQFEKLPIEHVRRSIYERLSELSTLRSLSSQGSNSATSNNRTVDWLVNMWMAVNDVIDLRDCDVYSFEDESLLEESDQLWSFHYFFVNRSLRRLVFFTCTESIDDKAKDEIELETMIMIPSESQMLDNSDFDYSNNLGDVILSGGGMSVPISTA